MATLFELKDEILKWRKIKRKDWAKYALLDVELLSYKDGYCLCFEHVFANDWELEPLPKVKKKKTMYQFVYHIDEGKNVYITSQLYESERAFIFANSCREILKTIPHEIEVEE